MKIIERDGAVVFESVQASEGFANLSGEFRWGQAMRRRGMAMDIAGLLPWNSHVKWHQMLRTAFTTTPRSGFLKPVWFQFREADKDLFHRISSACLGTTKAKPGESKTNFHKFWDIEIASEGMKHYLLPLPLGRGSSSGGQDQPSSSSTSFPNNDPIIRKLQNQLQQGQRELQNLKRKFEGNKGNDNKTKRDILILMKYLMISITMRYFDLD